MLPVGYADDRFVIIDDQVLPVVRKNNPGILPFFDQPIHRRSASLEQRPDDGIVSIHRDEKSAIGGKGIFGNVSCGPACVLELNIVFPNSDVPHPNGVLTLHGPGDDRTVRRKGDRKTEIAFRYLAHDVERPGVIHTDRIPPGGDNDAGSVRGERQGVRVFGRFRGRSVGLMDLPQFIRLCVPNHDRSTAESDGDGFSVVRDGQSLASKPFSHRRSVLRIKNEHARFGVNDQQPVVIQPFVIDDCPIAPGRQQFKILHVFLGDDFRGGGNDRRVSGRRRIRGSWCF